MYNIFFLCYMCMLLNIIYAVINHSSSTQYLSIVINQINIINLLRYDPNGYIIHIFVIKFIDIVFFLKEVHRHSYYLFNLTILFASYNW